MNFPPGIARCSLALDFHFGTSLACQKIELPRSRIIYELHVPALLHEMGRNADLIRKRPQTVRAVQGLAQPSFEGNLNVGRQCGLNTLSGNEKTKEAVVVLA